jgi:hypothetical protein
MTFPLICASWDYDRLTPSSWTGLVPNQSSHTPTQLIQYQTGQVVHRLCWFSTKLVPWIVLKIESIRQRVNSTMSKFELIEFLKHGLEDVANQFSINVG